MKNKNSRFLIISFVVMFILFGGIFIFLMNRMAEKSRAATAQIANLYMERMSSQITGHFETIIDIKLSQVESMIKIMPPDGALQGEELIEGMTTGGAARGFAFLGFLTEDGNMEPIYGDKLTVMEEEEFVSALKSGNKRIAEASVPSREAGLVLLGVPCEYDMINGDKSIALVAGIDLEYLRETLSLGDQADDTYCHIIRGNGDFIIKSDRAPQSNFFTRLYEIVPDTNDKNAEYYVTSVQDAIGADVFFTDVVSVGKEIRCMYLTPLSYCNWYLITVMSYNTLDDIILQLDTQRLNAYMAAIAVMFLIFIIVFTLFYRMTRLQLAETDKAYNEAIKANKAKSEFLSNMSHDIRTPMNAIVGMTAIASANIDDKQQLTNCLKKITLSSRHLLGLINDILDMSKIESGKMTLTSEPVSLRETMESIVSIIQPQVKTKNQQFDIFITDIIAEDVYCDSIRLNQVLINLLSNAYKFTPEGGEIRVFVDQQKSPKGDEYVRTNFRVKDNGIGMTAEFQKKIFESFVREDNARIRKTEGSGLGMAISKYIIDTMEGTIEVKSELNQGTEFYVTLDLRKVDIKDAEMVLPGCNMLLVDDDLQYCKDVVKYLKEMAVNCEYAADGKTAIEMVEERYKTRDDYRIVLLDQKMKEMDGIETAGEIHKRLGNDAPILLVSAYDWSDLEERAKEAGVNGFIQKPLFKSTLFRGLMQFIGSGEEMLRAQASSKKDFSGIRILLAEDNDLNYEIANELLTAIGIEVEWAQNGQICVDMFKKSSEGYYDVVLMDVRMPVMSGYEATEQIRALARSDADLPIIAMTADAFSEDVKKCKECGMNDHTSKPIDMEVLTHLLSRYLQLED